METFWKKQSAQRQLKQAVSDHAREEELDRIILNPLFSERDRQAVSKPYSVDYGDIGRKENSLQEEQGMMIQLVEHTALSARKYVLNLTHSIRIGNRLEGNDIMVSGKNDAAFQCEIFLAQGKAYVRIASGERAIFLRRRKKQIAVDRKGFRLLTGDKIFMGDLSYEITLMET